MRNDWDMKAGRSSVWKCTAVVVLLLCATQGSVASQASAEPATIRASESDFIFVGSPFQQPQGDVATFTNPSGSSAPHNVYASGRGPDGGPLFFSETIYPDSDTPVPGTQYLGSGSYPFVCTLHPGMAGTLQVTGSGSPVARPLARVSLPSQRLGAVIRKGAIHVVLESTTSLDGVTVTIRVGKRAIAFARAITLTAGSRKAITAKLFPQGKGLLKGKKSVTVSATSSVAFGKPSTSRKVLR